VERILASFPHPEMGYRSCLASSAGPTVSSGGVEAAAERALLAVRELQESGVDSAATISINNPEPARLRRAPFRPQQQSVAQLTRVREADYATSNPQSRNSWPCVWNPWSKLA